MDLGSTETILKIPLLMKKIHTTCECHSLYINPKNNYCDIQQTRGVAVTSKYEIRLQQIWQLY